LQHTAPTPLGMKVVAKTAVVAVEGRKITFKLEAFDEKEKIGEAVHERFIINEAKFNQRVESKRQ
jgi:fluoroacetyl-CoA thioesterase